MQVWATALEAVLSKCLHPLHCPWLAPLIVHRLGAGMLDTVTYVCAPGQARCLGRFHANSFSLVC